MLSIIDDPALPVRFLILDCPTESTLGFYIEQFINLNVHAVVRCCQPTYSAIRLSEHNIDVVDLPFKDGGVPSPALVHDWNLLIEKVRLNAAPSEPVKATIAVHCVAGLGRAPVLVAIALIEAGMDPLDSIENIRSKRRGAFNKPQIAYLVSAFNPLLSFLYYPPPLLFRSFSFPALTIKEKVYL
ncbi:protein-tyrosine phosphatase-like protein [Zychaea mexicana]|uniref:protein-tyrosine phosphatase-like protein n=1 Tax=Zychaea mexicana TaxID=64656 RepID=UPI0022FE8242|nr:protein-tyrosine phosphatase-like protein [Zychaea mexicana]KAI9498064.1 protein-tyrosine phosphatase-like protein [Zychaea mexicana]